MIVRGIKQGLTIELLEPLDVADGETVELHVEGIKSIPINFWEALQSWRSQVDWESLEGVNPWAGVRDRHPGREFSWDE